jgi:EAL domain-containing protein (putative c-di-GMP-specific phosphodiesterase class I)
LSIQKPSHLAAHATSPAIAFAAAAEQARILLNQGLKSGSQAVMILEVDGPFWTFAGTGPGPSAPLHHELHRRLSSLASHVIAVGAFRFIALAPSSSLELSRTLARRAMEIAAKPFDLGGSRIGLVAVAGAVFAKPGDDATLALRSTAAALNEARRRGRRLLMGHEFEAAYADLTGLADTVADMDRAIDKGRLCLALQPVMDAANEQVLHHEALLRVRTDGGALESAGRMIAAAEAMDVAYRLDLAVLELAAAALARDPELQIAINISAVTARDAAQSQAWLKRLARFDVDLGRVTVELTETAAPDDVGGAISTFAKEVRRLGARFSIDDFGSGYTSFSNLLALKPDEIKIDGCFVRDLRDDPNRIAFVKALVGLARDLGVSTVAEWVETAEDAATLKSLGVDALQGRFYGGPMPATPFEAQLRMTA